MSNGAALLAALSEMKQLVGLRLIQPQHAVWPARALSVYSALTASSMLRELEVCCDSMPDKAWLFAFSAGRILPGMRRFEWSESVWDVEGVSRLVSACAGLQYVRLSIHNSQAAVPLQRLTALTCLRLWDGGFSDCCLKSKVRTC